MKKNTNVKEAVRELELHHSTENKLHACVALWYQDFDEKTIDEAWLIFLIRAKRGSCDIQ